MLNFSKRQEGFTLLELIVSLAIVGAVFVVAAQSGMGDWSSKKTAQNIAKELHNHLADIKNHALSKNTTTRMEITNTGGVYTINTYYSSAPTSTCSSAGTWTTILTKNIDVGSTYQITGTGTASPVCFYRDGSSSGSAFTVSPSTTDPDLPTYELTISIATGYIDVSH